MRVAGFGRAPRLEAPIWSEMLASSDFPGQRCPVLRMGCLPLVNGAEVFGPIDQISRFRISPTGQTPAAPATRTEDFGTIDHAAGVCPGFGCGNLPFVVTRPEGFGTSDHGGRAHPKKRARLTTPRHRGRHWLEVASPTPQQNTPTEGPRSQADCWGPGPWPRSCYVIAAVAVGFVR